MNRDTQLAVALGLILFGSLGIIYMGMTRATTAVRACSEPAPVVAPTHPDEAALSEHGLMAAQHEFDIGGGSVYVIRDASRGNLCYAIVTRFGSDGGMAISCIAESKP